MTYPLFEIIDQMQAEAHGPHLGVIFNPAGMTGPEQRDEAMEKVLAKRDAQIYKGHLEAALFSFAVRDTFTIENLTGIVGRPPESVHFNAVGAIVRGMATRQLIEKTGRMIQAQRAIMHATELAEWRLLKYPERVAASYLYKCDECDEAYTRETNVPASIACEECPFGSMKLQFAASETP